MDYNSYSEKTERTKLSLTKERRVRRLWVLEDMLRSFSPGERLLLYGLSLLLSASTLVLLWDINAAVSVEVPARGGTLTEGEVGPARFINPVLTLSQPDEDLTVLVYSGLMRAKPDGTYMPDLAENYSISSDGTTYTFTLRAHATFQDGTPVSADDVLFTISLAQNPNIRSPRRADWEGVVASSPDPRTVVFKLPHAYAPFIENTTIGILPKHVWQNVSAEEFPFSPANTHPIGSGPYRVVSMTTDQTGSPTRYDLVPFDDFVLGQPYIAHITFLFYPNEAAMLTAFNQHKIDAVAGVTPEELQSVTWNEANVVRVGLPRTFGVFFNQSHAAVLADQSARQALDAAIDKRALVADVLGGYGKVLEGPIPPGVSGDVASAFPMPYVRASVASSTPDSSHAETARAILQKGGWVFDQKTNLWTKKKIMLSFTLATADEPELVETAHALAADWLAAGIPVSVQVYPLSELNNNILRPRAYDAILFGEVVGRSRDLFAFWHSSQRNDPGLNLAMYANSTADSLLSEGRAATDEKERDKLYAQFSTLIEKDVPAVFLYAPQFIYMLPTSVEGVELGALTTPAERFLNVYQWHTETEHVWSVFVK